MGCHSVSRQLQTNRGFQRCCSLSQMLSTTFKKQFLQFKQDHLQKYVTNKLINKRTTSKSNSSNITHKHTVFSNERKLEKTTWISDGESGCFLLAPAVYFQNLLTSDNLLCVLPGTWTAPGAVQEAMLYGSYLSP